MVEYSLGKADCLVPLTVMPEYPASPTRHALAHSTHARFAARTGTIPRTLSKETLGKPRAVELGFHWTILASNAKHANV